MRTSQIRPALAPPFDLAAARLHLRVDTVSADAQIAGLIDTARGMIEARTNRVFVATEFLTMLDAFPANCVGGAIELPYSPVIAVSEVAYLDGAGARVVLDPASYYASLGQGPNAPTARLTPAPGNYWPMVAPGPDRVEIRYTAGWGVPVVADPATDQLTIGGLGKTYADADPVRLWAFQGAAPGGLQLGATYYAVNVADPLLQVAATPGGAPIDFTDAGGGQLFIGELPTPLVRAMLLLISQYFENPATVQVGRSVAELPWTVEAICASYATINI